MASLPAFPTTAPPRPTSEGPLAAYERLALRLARAAWARVVLPRAEGAPTGTEETDGGEVAIAGCIARAAQLAGEEPLVVEETPELGQVCALPLGSPAESAGWLCVGRPAQREWRQEELEALVDLAALLAREVGPEGTPQQRRTLETLVRMLGTAVENMQLGVTVIDLDGRIIYTNPAEARMHGYAVGELVGRHARVLGPPELGRSMDAASFEDTRSWTRESVNVRKDGSRFPVLLWSDVVNDAGGRPVGIVTCCEDVTERKRSEQQLKDSALRDALTGLPNRTRFLERLTQAIERHSRAGAGHFAVLFLDLDRFKVVNDSLGHHVGDELLRIVGSRLQACVRPSDTVARFGGDEFAVLLELLPHPEEATRVAQRIQAVVSQPIQLGGYELFTSASVGIALGSGDADQAEYLWRSADMAMYRAKAAGTGRFEVFDRAMHAEALARLQLETDLRHAMEREEFRLCYQPVVGAGGRAGGGLRGAGALEPPAARRCPARRLHPRLPRRPASSCAWATGCSARPAGSWASGGRSSAGRRSGCG